MVVIQVEMQMGQEACLCLTSGDGILSEMVYMAGHSIIELDNLFWEEKLKQYSQ